MKKRQEEGTREKAATQRKNHLTPIKSLFLGVVFALGRECVCETEWTATKSGKKGTYHDSE